MSRYDYRIRRQLFRKRNIDQYKNFDSIERQYRSRKRTHSIVRSLLILIALVVIIGLIVFSANADTKPKGRQKPVDPVEVKFSNLPERL